MIRFGKIVTFAILLISGTEICQRITVSLTKNNHKNKKKLTLLKIQINTHACVNVCTYMYV